MPPTYPKYEILHSAEYWKTLRDNRARCLARQANPAPPDPMRDFNIDFFPHPEIVTFAQTRDAVYYSRRAPNGALVPLPDSAGVDSADADSSAAAPAPAPAPAPGVPKRRIVWDPPTAARHAHATATASRRRQRDSDAELLARFALSRQKAQREVDLKKAARERLKAKKLAGSEATQLPSGTHK